MARRISLAVAFLAAVSLFVPQSVLAGPPDKPAGKPTAPPAMDEKAIMEIYMKAATPGPEHQEMAKLAGSWKLEVTSWMAPGAPPEKSTATAEFKTMLGGRYMQQTVRGEMGGQPYEGTGIEGFDNVTKERWGIWIDSMGTGPMISRGKCPVGAKSCTLSGTYNDPMSGKATTAREVLTRNGDNSFTFDLYGPDPSGKEFHMMRIVYTRG